MALACGLTYARGNRGEITKMNPGSPKTYKEKKIIYRTFIKSLEQLFF
jgi:hypothetical protein